MKHTLEQKVYYADTDAYGVVWHGAYLRWLEMGRTEFASEMGHPICELQDEGIVLPVVNINVRYKSSARLNDELIIETTVQKFNSLTVTFEQKIMGKNTGKTFVEALIDVVAIDNNGKLYRRMPQVLVEMFERAINNETYAIK